MRTGSEQPGGAAPEPQRPAPGGIGAWVVGVVLGLVVIGLILAAWTLGKEQGEDDARGSTTVTEQTTTAPAPAPTPAAPTAQDRAARELFAGSCAGCHTLAAAGATGTAGPDLDALGPDGARVLAAIANGGSGVGAMPANLLQGAQAQQVADYVAKVAGGG